jgi:hypothetical protein
MCETKDFVHKHSYATPDHDYVTMQMKVIVRCQLDVYYGGFPPSFAPFSLISVDEISSHKPFINTLSENVHTEGQILHSRYVLCVCVRGGTMLEAGCGGFDSS